MAKQMNCINIHMHVSTRQLKTSSVSNVACFINSAAIIIVMATEKRIEAAMKQDIASLWH